MFKTIISAAVLAVGVLSVPANAVTYDAFASFNGTSTGGAFTYGTYNGSTFTAFNDTPGCAALITDVICTSDGFLPAAFKSTGGAHQSGSVIVPADALVLHPGPNAGQTSAILFTAPTAGAYSLDFSAFVADTNPSGVDILIFLPGNGFATVAVLSASNPTYSTGALFIGALPAGYQFGFAVDYDGTYNNDSTGIKFTVASVPEPATWGLMITGFGMVGVASRRRSRALAA